MSISDSIPSDELRWYSVNEVAAHFGVAVDTVYLDEYRFSSRFSFLR